MTSPEPTAESNEPPDPGMVRAGAAAAARRRELNISQRSLAANGVINAGALIAFEKGRSWPRERTRAKLEEVLRWQPGTISRMRAQDEPGAEPDRTASSSSGVALPVIVETIQVAVSLVDPSIDALPDPTDPEFTPKVTTILANLRQLEIAAVRAVQIGTATPPLIKTLSAVRTRYDRLMLRAATAARPTLGQRLYAARRGANLTIGETAQAAGVREDDIAAAEAERPVPAVTADAIETLLAELA
ncbi:helix-turn-helix domain-containing protein [Mycobacterium sp. IDR2000157661]|uniref:helix-turn-helix domain-containing protein n=1 Tax=Mycobacterium sp. IDR2000157661 TaxID=2867005 RepID=UPI001EEEC6A9|nr:helix-turn-helix domain-containing protein [Mycobacterium sp. IDR2000157661]ULE35609.1 helix-turn-helix domain-containing protein [Mycobacterium sp. IDR2000157661]